MPRDCGRPGRFLHSLFVQHFSRGAPLDRRLVPSTFFCTVLRPYSLFLLLVTNSLTRADFFASGAPTAAHHCPRNDVAAAAAATAVSAAPLVILFSFFSTLFIFLHNLALSAPPQPSTLPGEGSTRASHPALTAHRDRPHEGHRQVPLRRRGHGRTVGFQVIYFTVGRGVFFLARWRGACE